MPKISAVAEKNKRVDYNLGRFSKSENLDSKEVGKNDRFRTFKQYLDTLSVNLIQVISIKPQ